MLHRTELGFLLLNDIHLVLIALLEGGGRRAIRTKCISLNKLWAH